MGSGKEIDQNLKTAGTVQPVLLPLFVILLLTIVTQLAHLVYNSSRDFQSIVLPSVLYLSLTTIPLAWLGIWFGRQIGLGTPLLAAVLQKQPGAWKKLLNDARIAIPLGLSLGAALVLLRVVTAPYLPPEIPVFGHRGVIGGVLVSAAAAMSEEVWFRLGIMTMLLWSFTRLLRHNSIRPSVAWSVIVLVAVGFGLAHLPQLNAHGAASPFAIWATIIGNSLVGTLFGWCYWRLSFVAAVIAHFAVDVAIHAIPALLI
jgi:uncharacterized membrane protein